MTIKTIAVRKEVYELLLSLKEEKESFSDFLERLAKTALPFTVLEKIEGSLNLGDTEELIKEIRKKREE
ncbi:MAG: hypothetical protein GF308_06710 [Candidatus Heimdallarchaeota archaeon]|nr:hypothetical protein [Candidatus Heimdallarchaeota archaeon]